VDVNGGQSYKCKYGFLSFSYGPVLHDDQTGLNASMKIASSMTCRSFVWFHCNKLPKRSG
jgi:hypothetical protein